MRKIIPAAALVGSSAASAQERPDRFLRGGSAFSTFDTTAKVEVKGAGVLGATRPSRTTQDSRSKADGSSCPTGRSR